VQVEDIVARIKNDFEGVVPKSSWGKKNKTAILRKNTAE